MNTPPTITPTQAAQPKRRGCFFYGCITSLVLLLVIGLVAAFVVYKVASALNGVIANYTEAQPATLPGQTLSDTEVKALHARVDAFNKSLEAGSNAPPLVLSGPEVNAILADAMQSGDFRKFKNCVSVSIDDDKVKGQVSLPVEGMLHVPLLHTKGRYLNGAVTFKVSLTNQFLSVFINSLEVKGQPLPEQFMSQIRNQNFAQDQQNHTNPGSSEKFSHYQSIEVKGGNLIVTPSKSQ